jgi:hypothetical protein
VTITGFVEVWLVAAAGADVTGIFIEQVIDGAPSPGAPDGGTLHVSLLR